MPPGGLLLDAGYGAGAYSLPLARRGYRVHGVDVSPGQIAEACRRAKAQGLGEEQARFDVGDLEHLPLPDGAVDGMLCWPSSTPTARSGSTRGANAGGAFYPTPRRSSPSTT